MSVREVKVFYVECDRWYPPAEHEREGHRCPSKAGPYFTAYEYEARAQAPPGWGSRTLHGCGMTGYTRTDVYCPNCISELGLETEPLRS